MRPLRIGVSACLQNSSDLRDQYIPPKYVRALTGEGLEPVLIAYDTTDEQLDRLMETLAGVLFPGGPDVHPSLYGREIEPKCGVIRPERDSLELRLLEKAILADLPVLGICRGEQVLNVGLGGTLIQDVPSAYGANHRQEKEAMYHHAVRIERGSFLHSLAGEERVMVNSFHHQCIERVAPPLRVTACSEPDGVIEAIEWPEKRFFVGVEWHPERSYGDDALSKAIFKAFAAACRGE